MELFYYIKGTPIAKLLSNMNATVTLCHSKTVQLEAEVITIASLFKIAIYAISIKSVKCVYHLHFAYT